MNASSKRAMLVQALQDALHALPLRKQLTATFQAYYDAQRVKFAESYEDICVKPATYDKIEID